MAVEIGGIIKSIDQSTVHKICSGQVVLTLAVAVKELVENSLDSGATVVDVRLREFGSELVEVNDNGHGISPLNFETLCLKHYTSKLQEFEDLPNVETFGFRGEALSSLCALSNLSVTTCEQGQPVGWKLEYDSHGRLCKQSQYSRQPGTTVMLCNLFHSLPVRHKEFIKNLKREFNKMLTVLTGYCLISKGTRITCTNTSTGRLNTVLSTKGATNLKDNFTLIYGIKSWQNMLELTAIRPSEEILAEFGLTTKALPESEPLFFEFEGFVSTCAHGQGRSCSDRQYYFVNGRPCDPVKVSKLVNEVYHAFNRHQYPCVVLNVIMRKSEVDINVTPDKRQILVSNEKILLATVKASLLHLYQKIPATFILQNTSLSQFSIMETSSTEEEKAPTRNIRASLAAFAANGWKPQSSSSPMEKRKYSSASNRTTYKPDFINNQTKKTFDTERRMDTFLTKSFSPPGKRQRSSPENVKVEIPSPGSPTMEEHSIKHKESYNSLKESELDSSTVHIVEVSDENVEVIETIEDLESAIEEVLPVSHSAPDKAFTTITLSMESLSLAINKKIAESDVDQSSKRFLARINPNSNTEAEAELSRQIKQSDFGKMEIVGQFNLGFMIAKLNSDLFIIDQHAADEKYNFETLQRTTRLKPQRLVCSKVLNLTAANEALLMDNIEIFRNNGFDFAIKKDEEPTRRVALSSVPMSGNWLFGPSDVDELLFILQDSPFNFSDESTALSQAQMARFRPSRVRAMFASRACRKAVMVGDPLTSSQMKKLVTQLGDLEQPWNCPHGRPTMRHLINLEMLQ